MGKINESNPTLQETQWGKQCNVILKLMVEFLQQNVPNFFEPSVWPPNSPDINPVNYAVWGAL